MKLFPAAATVDCAAVFEKIGCKVKRLSDERSVLCCPFHGEKTPSLYVYRKSQRSDFYCFGCRRHGDATDVYAWHYNLRNVEAAKRICADFRIEYEDHQRTPPGEIERIPSPPRAEARILCAAVIHWRNHYVRLYRDAAERAQEKMQQCIDMGEACDLTVFNTYLEECSSASLQAERWNAMSVACVLQELQEEIAKHLGAPLAPVKPVRNIPIKGVAT